MCKMLRDKLVKQISHRVTKKFMFLHIDNGGDMCLYIIILKIEKNICNLFFK